MSNRSTELATPETLEEMFIVLAVHNKTVQAIMSKSMVPDTG